MVNGVCIALQITGKWSSQRTLAGLLKVHMTASTHSFKFEFPVYILCSDGGKRRGSSAPLGGQADGEFREACDARDVSPQGVSLAAAIRLLRRQ